MPIAFFSLLSLATGATLPCDLRRLWPPVALEG